MSHTHARYDRDDFVDILFDNVHVSVINSSSRWGSYTGRHASWQVNFTYNFAKMVMGEFHSYNVPYDFASIMHYSSRAVC